MPDDVDEMQAVQVAREMVPGSASARRLSAGVMARPAYGTAGRNNINAAPADLQELVNSAGQPLDAASQEFFESRFGHDFSQVRLHSDLAAAGSASALGALAFTYGSHIAFSPGSFQPRTTGGRRLLAHELTHVVQQGFAPALGAQASLVGNRAGGMIQRQGRGQRAAEEGREEGRETRTSRGYEDDLRRERPGGGRSRDRRRDPLSDFESDWAGRAILERYLAGEGDWEIKDDPRWTGYLERSRLLRNQLQSAVIDEARTLAVLHLDATFPIIETLHAELENGEGIVGYQYLHGTNADVGDFLIAGLATVEHVYGESVLGVEQSIQPGAMVTMQLRFVWNDKIDPNYSYGSDTIKSVFAEVISFGEAESYRLSIAWTEDCRVWLPEEGNEVVLGYPGPR